MFITFKAKTVVISNQQPYSIKDLENFTQIKAHTIRVWEQRYNLLNPKRTESNIRYYEEADLKKLLNIKLLKSSGFKISKIAGLSEDEVITQSKKIIKTSGNQDLDKWSNDLILFILEFEVVKIKKALNKTLRESGMAFLHLERVLPLMKTIGELWQVNAIGIVHEHFFSNIYRKLLFAEINKLPLPPAYSEKALLFLHGHEEHEFSLMLYYYLLKKRGITCYYFGQKTPVSEIESVQAKLNADYIITTFSAQISQRAFDKIMNVLKRFSEHSKVIISGSLLNAMRMSSDYPRNIHRVQSSEELFELV